ncbi:MAG: MmgE/PrpD family protein [Microbacteriaceae bacterium]
MSLRQIGTAVRAIADDRLPDHVERWARTAITDTLAVIAGGTGTELFARAATTASRHPGTVPVPGLAVRTSAMWSAHLAAIAASALDYDDGHYRGGGIHASSTVLPVLLAGAAEATLPELVRAFVAGHEIAIRAGHLAAPERSGESYRASGYAATIGAAAALAALRGGDADRIASAIRLAFAHAPHSRMTSTAARESIGWAGATAVAVVELAEAGYASETTDGALHAPAGPTPFEEASDDPMIASLGRVFESPDSYLKPWASCRAAHAMIEALLELRRRHDLGEARAIDIRAIDIRVIDAAVVLDVTAPADLSEAQYALPWLAAVALLRDPARLARLDPEDFAAADLFALATRVRLRPGLPPAANGGYPAHVTVTLADGTRLEHGVELELGSPERPLGADRLARKWAALLETLPALSLPAIAEVIDDRDARVIELLELLARPVPGAG